MSRPGPETAYALGRCRDELLALLERYDVKASAAEIRDVQPGIDADLAVPVFRTAKELGRKPVELADELAGRLELDGTSFESVSSLRGYLNFRLDRPRFCAEVIADFRRDPDGFGRSELGAGRTVVIDYSSPNIAKPFSVGHLRSTIIGQALHNILGWLGWNPVGDNHLGDWGTQFGRLLCAFQLWGNEEELDRSSTRHLLDLYVRFHEQAKTEPGLEKQARDWFRRLETGDPEARRLWQRFVELSRAEFQRIYDLLGVSIDNTLGESFYEDRLGPLVDRALAAGVARSERPPDDESGDEVVLIPLESAGIDTPLLLRKSDGTSLYATRELATAEYRIERWHPAALLYVVGNEQQLYFRQFAVALKLLGRDLPVVHVNFGLIRLPEGRMSTREGRVILLEDVIEEAVRRARDILADREMPEDKKQTVARQVGIGALKYADLSQTRVKEVVFDWDRMLALDGDSAPYLQYAHTRCRSILRKAGGPAPDFDPALLARQDEFALLSGIARFPDAIAAAGAAYEPHRIANHVYRLARDFSVFYNAAPVLAAPDPETRAARLGLVEMTAACIRIGLNLLGIELPDRM